MTNETKFAKNLQVQIEDKDITMKALADKTGITYNMIKKYCHGEAEPTISYALKIAKELGVSLDDLLGYKAKSKGDMFREVFERDFTYIESFMRTVRKFENKEALVDPVNEKSWTYKELNADVNKLANALISRGVGKGDVVMYQLNNCAEFVFSYLAPQKFGAVNSPANPNFSAGETASCLNSSKPKVYIYEEAIKETALRAIERAEEKPEIIIMTGEGKAPKGHVKYEEFVSSHSEKEPETGFEPHMYDEVTRLYTSGTTGMPKGVPILNANEVMTSHDVLMHFPMNANDTTMNMTPWFHRGGIHSGGPSPTFYAGGRVVIMRAFQPTLALKYAEKYEITFLIGVPSVMKMLMRKQDRFKADLSKLRGLVTMGAPFERADCIRIHNTLSKNLFNGYGTTETFWNTFLRPYNLPEMSGTAGQACTDDEVRVIKTSEDKRIEPDVLVNKDEEEVGEVIIRTPKSSYRYFGNPAEEKNKFYKGWMYTGDLATWDKNQFISIVGRKDDMIISGGENIYPPIIEEAINGHPKVKECAVTGVPDSVRGEAVVAYVVPEDESLTVQELTIYCGENENLSQFKKPRYYRFVEELPMTATGKLQHNIVKEMALTDQDLGRLKPAMKK